MQYQPEIEKYLQHQLKNNHNLVFLAETRHLGAAKSAQTIRAQQKGR